MARELVQKVEISHRTVAFTVFFLLGLWFIYEIRQIIILAFISLILMAAFNPVVDGFEKIKVPRPLGIFITYVMVLLVLAGAVLGVVPLVVAQTMAFSQRVPDILRVFQNIGIGRETISSQLGQLWSVPLNLLGVLVDIFSNILNFVVVAAVTFYLLMERKNLDDYLSVLFGPEGDKRAKRVVDQLEGNLGRWVRGEVVLMTSVGLMNFLGFKVLGIDFALPLGILAGILEIIPNVGPIIAGIVAVVSGLSISPIIGLGALAWAFIVQQIEAHVLVPKVMQSATGVHPIVSILSLLVGLKLAGTAGAILAIPTVIVVSVVVNNFLLDKGLLKVGGKRRAGN